MHKITNTSEARRYSATLPQLQLSLQAQVTCISRNTSLGINCMVALRLGGWRVGEGVSSNTSGLRGEEEIPVRTRNAAHSQSLH